MNATRLHCSAWRNSGLPTALFVLAAFVATGCGSRGGSVTIEPAGQAPLAQSFKRAYIAQSPNRAGEYDVILVDSSNDWEPAKTNRKRPLQPAELETLRQVMHIHLQWRPLAGTKKNPASINAAIDWYVFGPGGSGEVLVYKGAGYVVAEGGGRTRAVSIRDGQVRLELRKGEMQDPIGSGTVTGSVVAESSSVRVRETLAEITRLTGAPSK